MKPVIGLISVQDGFLMTMPEKFITQKRCIPKSYNCPKWIQRKCCSL